MHMEEVAPVDSKSLSQVLSPTQKIEPWEELVARIHDEADNGKFPVLKRASSFQKLPEI